MCTAVFPWHCADDDRIFKSRRCITILVKWIPERNRIDLPFGTKMMSALNSRFRSPHTLWPYRFFHLNFSTVVDCGQRQPRVDTHVQLFSGDHISHVEKIKFWASTFPVALAPYAIFIVVEIARTVRITSQTHMFDAWLVLVPLFSFASSNWRVGD